MKIIEKIKNKQNNLVACPAVTIAFLGDSVTQGCFECYYKLDGNIETVFDVQSSYSSRLKQILNLLYPNVQFNIINSGISGDSAPSGLERLDRDVLNYNPDLVIVSYGLNDSCYGEDGIKKYGDAVDKILNKLNEKQIDTIFLTQNYMNTAVSPFLSDDRFVELAKNFSQNIQNNGLLKRYFDKAKEICAKYNVKVCDMYSQWNTMANNGVNTTELLANKLNHPIKQMHYYIAIKLIEMIMD